MKLITKDTDYAIRALCFIAVRKKEIVTAKKLVEVLNIPRPFLRNILQRLNKRKILKSYRGKSGGFLLTRPTNKILVTDVIKIFQGPVKLSEHVFQKGLCPNIRTCALKKRLDIIERHVTQELQRITIASLTRDVKCHD